MGEEGGEGVKGIGRLRFARKGEGLRKNGRRGGGGDEEKGCFFIAVVLKPLHVKDPKMYT